MIRIETYLDGHLVKEIGQVNIGPTIDKPYDEWVDGRHHWLLDSVEITENEARTILAGTTEALDHD